MTLEAEPGCDINHACEEATRIADMLGVTVQFNFNGVTCWAIPGGSPASLRESFKRQLQGNDVYKFACAKRSGE